MAKKPRPITTLEINGHVLRVYLASDGTRRFQCDSWPDLATVYDGAWDSSPCVAEFERRASGGVVKADDTSKGAA